MTTTISSFEMRPGAGMPRTLRLTSQAENRRPQRTAPSAGTATSVYDTSLGKAAETAHGRCVESRAAVKRNDMVHEAAMRVPIEAYDSIKSSLEGSFATIDDLAATAAQESKALESMHTEASKEQLGTFGALCDVLAKDERHGIEGAMVKQFFAGGSIEGPFAGSRSAQGEWMASTFYAHARPFGGAFATVKPSPYSESGYRLHNFNHVG